MLGITWLTNQILALAVEGGPSLVVREPGSVFESGIAIVWCSGPSKARVGGDGRGGKWKNRLHSARIGMAASQTLASPGRYLDLLSQNGQGVRAQTRVYIKVRLVFLEDGEAWRHGV